MKKKKQKIRLKRNTRLLVLLILLFICLSINKQQTSEAKQYESKNITVEEKLKKLNNVQKKVEYFNEEYINRYYSYQINHKKLSSTQVIKDVNMNLDKKEYEESNPAKGENTDLVFVNKYYYLSSSYIPNNLESISIEYAKSNMRLVSSAKNAFEEMAKQAKIEGLNIIAMSTYRSYDYQVNLYNRYVKKDGKEKADTYSARPGYSEHQTGLAVDVYNGIEDYSNFENTQEFIWMSNNAHKYGFILRYPKGKENETKYQYESWHYRYVGVEVATYVKEQNITLEEYYATIIKDW